MRILSSTRCRFSISNSMRIQTKILSAILFFALCLCLAPIAAAGEKVWCSCATIKADGKGTTNCTANESNGRCTIDYNVFGTREIRTAEVLSEYLEMSFTAYPHLGVIAALNNAAGEGNLHRQVQLYLMIATVDQLDTYPDSVPTDGFREVNDVVESYENEIGQAFSPTLVGFLSGYDETDARQHGGFHYADNAEVVISPGCISVQTSSINVMFKTFWAPARWFPRCRQL